MTPTGNEFPFVGEKLLATELHIFLSSETYLIWNPTFGGQMTKILIFQFLF